FEDLYELMKMFWGAKNEEGQFVSPTKEDYAQSLNEHVATVTPTRSDLKKQRKIRKRISFNLESSVFESSASSSSSSNYLNDVNRDSSSDKRRRLNGEKESAFGSSLF
ncbi:MAG TPA: hypothetical protein DCE71_01590, partial [Parachlamydiales bacterium]|nr:hypothetical protein [Parachlamydiales bacterium]